MNKNIFGQYDFRNNTEINFLNSNEHHINSTILHETVHLLLTQQTRWGLFCYCARRIKVYDDSYKHIMFYLCEQSRKIHEGTAVFAECIYLIQTYGYDSYIKYIKNLKENNKKYYTYIKPLIFFLELLNPVVNKDLITPDEVYKLVFGLAKVAMNSDLCQIPLDVLRSKKKFKKIISNNETSYKYLPNRRFETLIKTSKNILIKKEEFLLDVLLEEILKLHEDESEIFKEIFYTDEDTLKIYETFLNDIKKYFQQLYKSSTNIEPIKIFLNSINVKIINLEDLPQYSIPHSFTNFEPVKSEYSNVITLVKDKLGILFYLGNIGEISSIDSDLAYIPTEVIESIKKTIRDKSHLSIFYDYESKKSHNFNASKKDIEDLICSYGLTVVVNYKEYDTCKDDIKGLNTYSKQIFIYCDRSYPNSITIINKISTTKSKCRFIEYRNMYLLIIKISEKSNFILPLLPISYKQALSDIKNKKLNIELSDNPDGVSLTDEFILTSDESVLQYDLIINCLFQT